MQGVRAHLASLPRERRSATVHAALACQGRNMQYDIVPGFGPGAPGLGAGGSGRRPRFLHGSSCRGPHYVPMAVYSRRFAASSWRRAAGALQVGSHQACATRMVRSID
eukprot:8624780-Pyramimonas_sp.AAC.1